MQPQFKILANQTDITQSIQQRLISIRITDESGIKGDTLRLDTPSVRAESVAQLAELNIYYDYLFRNGVHYWCE